MPQPGYAQPGYTQSGYTQPSFTQAAPAQPSFQPNGTRAAGRQPDRAERADWDRTERMDRVAAGYPDPRLNGRAHDGRSHDGRPNDGVPRDGVPRDGVPRDGRPQDGRGRDIWSQDINGYDTGSQPRTGRTGADDDPLTSKAYSRSALTDTDGRSYRAARLANGSSDRREAALTEETQAFSTTTGSYPAEPQPAGARYPGSAGYGGQQPGQHPYDHGNTASYPYPGQPYPARPPQGQNGGQKNGRYRHARPAGQGNNGNGNGNGGYSGRR
jgi:hypothetical protein